MTIKYNIPAFGKSKVRDVIDELGVNVGTVRKFDSKELAYQLPAFRYKYQFTPSRDGKLRGLKFKLADDINDIKQSF